MPAKLVFDNISNELDIPEEVLPEDEKPYDHHFQGSTLDNLVELCGRICYDSCNTKKSRNSKDYHNHINEVNHGSVQEHPNLTFHVRNPRENHERDSTYDDKLRWQADVYSELVNRPGVYIREDHYEGFYITANLRAILEWNNFGGDYNSIGKDLQNVASEFAPLVFGDKVATIDGLKPKTKNSIKVIKPNTEEEIWASFYISGVSRGLSHELVRHKYRTAVSQRSTRYVDESESEWAWHPLLKKYSDKEIIQNLRWETPQDYLIEAETICKYSYGILVDSLEEQLTAYTDRFQARKQARGAARGILGNALSTELIFSASLAQWKRMLRQRMSDAADAEIRLLFNDIFDVLKNKFSSHFENWETTPASDGIGLSLDAKHT